MAVDYLIDVHGLSIRRACASVGLARAAWYRAPINWRVRDQPVIEALLVLSEHKPGLGFWKLFGRLRRQGHRWNHKRV
jgi:putative transposase